MKGNSVIVEKKFRFPGSGLFHVRDNIRVGYTPVFVRYLGQKMCLFIVSNYSDSPCY